jgi:hypothetical protein
MCVVLDEPELKGTLGVCRYDRQDMVSHMFRQLAAGGYQGTPIHAMFRDEVQDFTQGELLMDLR